jgi:hypothetical protein
VTYVDSSLIQLSGEIGLLSLGLEKNFSRYSIGGLYGLVPGEISGGPVIETVTLRQTYRFWDWKRLGFYGGLNIFHVLGLNYHTEDFRDAPRNYYAIGNLRALLNLGLQVQIKPEKSFYFEAGMNDLWIENYVSNSNAVNPSKHVSLAMGFKHSF